MRHLRRVRAAVAAGTVLQASVAIQQHLVLQRAEAHQVPAAGGEAAHVAVCELDVADLRDTAACASDR